MRYIRRFLAAYYAYYRKFRKFLEASRNHPDLVMAPETTVRYLVILRQEEFQAG